MDQQLTAIENLNVSELPLAALHDKAGATFKERDGWRLPAFYRNASEEYDAVRQHAGVIDLSSRGRIHVSGSEAVMFLNGLITNDMKTLEESHWMPAVFPTVQGRLIASVRIIRQRDVNGSPSFLIDTEANTHDQVMKTIARFTMAGDFHVTDLRSTAALFSVQGPAAQSLIVAVLHDGLTSLAHDGVSEIEWLGRSVTAIRSTHTAEDGFDLIVDKAGAETMWEALLTGGARPVGHDALEVLRIEAGIPRYGHDMDESNVVVETNLDDAISYTKGCYIGQEIIARIKYRGHVAKKLSGLLFNGDVTVTEGATIKSLEGKDIGRVTSATYSPTMKQTIALGYVRYEYLAAGTHVTVSGTDSPLDATVHALPFVRGSWYD